jgi:hypothetical protein
VPIDFLSVLAALQARDVRYVVVGGLAVLLHGVDRLTADIDLVVDLAPEQASKAIDVLMDLGFKAHAPVDPRRFADPAMRETWRQDFGMVVMSFWDPENRRPTIDLFAEYPMDFEDLFRHSVLMPLSSTEVRVASVEHLIAIKQATGRPKDLDDAARLIELRDAR